MTLQFWKFGSVIYDRKLETYAKVKVIKAAVPNVYVSHVTRYLQFYVLKLIREHRIHLTLLLEMIRYAFKIPNLKIPELYIYVHNGKLVYLFMYITHIIYTVRPNMFLIQCVYWKSE